MTISQGPSRIDLEWLLMLFRYRFRLAFMSIHNHSYQLFKVTLLTFNLKYLLKLYLGTSKNIIEDRIGVLENPTSRTDVLEEQKPRKKTLRKQSPRNEL